VNALEVAWGRSRLGVFNKRAHLVNGWPSYTRVGDSNISLWHAEVWYIGPTSMIGEHGGHFTADDGALHPELVAATWRMAGNSMWVDAPLLRCIAGEALRAELAAADTIALVGLTPQDLQQQRLGVFTKRAELVNGRPSYDRAGDSQISLWHTGLSWMVGMTSNMDMGKHAGSIRAHDGALRPELIEATWSVWDGKWHDAPSLRVLHSGRATAATAPSAAATPPSAAVEVEVVGERTREQKDAELLKSAVDLDAPPVKRSRDQLAELEARALPPCTQLRARPPAACTPWRRARGDGSLLSSRALCTLMAQLLLTALLTALLHCV
jgi:hypothetical protein